MTLCLSVKTEEGLVIAADSLGTLLALDQKTLQIRCDCGKEGVPLMKCNSCGKDLGQTPPLIQHLPATHTYHCEKLFKITRFTGLAVAGMPQLADKKIQHWIVSFISSLDKEEYFEEIANLLEKKLKEEEIEKKATDLVELLLVGVCKNVTEGPRSIVIKIAPGSFTVAPSTNYGISVIGVHEILDKMFTGGGIKEYPVKLFPLQDAVEFAYFLMQTQIGVDKYSNRIPRVGGDVDLAVIHPYYGFKWVKQKKLQALFDEREKGNF